ncbi:HNH endonuclease [Ignatzschineria sp. LJL83]
MNQLYEHPATDPKFKAIRKKFEAPLQQFHDFAEQQSIKVGKAQKPSGKAGSYRLYLIRYILLYQEKFKEEIHELNTFDTLRKINRINELPDFRTLNRGGLDGKKGHGFFSATFTCFKEFLIHLASTSEDQSDIEFQTKINNIKDIDGEKVLASILKTPKPRPEKSTKPNASNAYTRNPIEGLAAKILSEWNCELNPSHTTFIADSHNKPFLEAHHLVPMAFQNNFDHSLDFTGNIVALCPNCHRLIHHSEPKTKKEALQKLYQLRKEKLNEFGIEIELNTLLKYYNIQ